MMIQFEVQDKGSRQRFARHSRDAAETKGASHPKTKIRRVTVAFLVGRAFSRGSFPFDAVRGGGFKKAKILELGSGKQSTSMAKESHHPNPLGVLLGLSSIIFTIFWCFCLSSACFRANNVHLPQSSIKQSWYKYGYAQNATGSMLQSDPCCRPSFCFGSQSPF